MKSAVAEKINTKILQLERELGTLKTYKKTAEKKIEQLKSKIHHDEFELLKDGSSDDYHAAYPLKFFSDVQSFRHDRQDLQKSEKELKETVKTIASLTKEINRLRFWRDRADTSDEKRQREAEVNVFGS